MAWMYDPIEGPYWEDDPVDPNNVDPDQYDDGTYRSPVDQQGGYGEPIEAAPPPGADSSDPWNETTGNWNPEQTTAAPNPSEPPPPPGPVVGPTPPDNGGGGGGGSSWSGPSTGSLNSPYGRTFQRPDMAAAVKEALGLLPGVPTYNAPELPTIDPWKEPGPEAIYNDPSFDFRKGIGEKALLNSRAAQGLTRSGGTLKDLLDYNQNFASQEWGNMRNRSLEGWRTNTDTTLRRAGMDQDRARSMYEPQFAEYQNKVAVASRTPQLAYDNAWREYLQDYDQFRDQRDSVFDKLRWQSEFGLDAATR